MRDGAPCTSQLAHDADVAECGSWCNVAQSHHCSYCKCKSCSFCASESEVDHVYASAGSAMVACDEGTVVPHPTTSVSLEQCKSACDSAPGSACRSFSYSNAEQACSLRKPAGEPKCFSSRGDWITHWRVEIRRGSAPPPPPIAATAAAAMAAAVAASATGSSGGVGSGLGTGGQLPRRVLVQGSRLLDSATGVPLRLHGLNMYLDYLHFDDMALMRQLLPTANFVRLVGVFWHDSADASGCSCCTEDASRGYYADTCLDHLKQAIRTITSRGLWVLVAAKARYAAGEGWPAVSDVFHDAELAGRYRALWAHLARELAGMSMLMGFEPMSEPRNKHVTQASVRSFYEGVCATVRHRRFLFSSSSPLL